MTVQKLVVVLREREQYKVEPEEFCEKWIPKLYGIEPGQHFFKLACIQEFKKHLDNLDVDSAYKNWRWGDNVKEQYPQYLPSVLKLLDKQYSALEILGGLPRYSIDYSLLPNQSKQELKKPQ